MTVQNFQETTRKKAMKHMKLLNLFHQPAIFAIHLSIQLCPWRHVNLVSTRHCEALHSRHGTSRSAPRPNVHHPLPHHRLEFFMRKYIYKLGKRPEVKKNRYL